MRKLYYYAAVLLLLMAFSCAKDKGNYDYGDGEFIEISGIETSYNAISQKDTVKIAPVAKSNKEGELEYRWGIYETNVQGRVEPLDTIARTQNLSYFVKEEAKGWVLVFMARNKKTGYTQYKTTSLTVSTLFTRGWYVLKDDGTNSDLDLYLTPQNNTVSGKMEDVYSQVNGQKIQGTGVFLSFATNYKTNILNPNVFANTRTLFASTSKDIQAIGINTMKYIRNREDIFLGGARPVNGAAAVFNGSAATYILNDNQLFNIYAMSANSGLFGNRIMMDGTNSPYALSKYMFSSAGTDPILFDNTSGSFVTLGNGSGSVFTVYTDAATNTLKTKNNNHTALFLGYKSSVYLPAPDYYSRYIGYAILQDKTDPAVKRLCYLVKDKFVLTVTPEVINPSSKLYDASHYTLLVEDENLLYFVNNNEVYSRNLSNGFEQLQYAIPGSEVVTFIKHLKYTESASPGYSFNYIIVGTKSGSEYKIRMFNKVSGNLEATPVQTITGKGNANSIIYIAPSVSEYTYPSSY
ncbi:PKD-like family lipoprotein [Sphingobacterium psychroaquaticum]|uniref:PKD-like family protein n=1 Tax=Sphingobacterium psychroaquaticum TaxID=561061 RepID=A0A1X7K4E8_9SPHI|nr:PKD-like family lipoprotein [Sphingobacterium psychroaquaticum]SMG35875.1 PKD-like family protein [Sphingobacterium psychroaquaticum]